MDCHEPDAGYCNVFCQSLTIICHMCTPHGSDSGLKDLHLVLCRTLLREVSKAAAAAAAAAADCFSSAVSSSSSSQEGMVTSGRGPVPANPHHRCPTRFAGRQLAVAGFIQKQEVEGRAEGISGRHEGWSGPCLGRQQSAFGGPVSELHWPSPRALAPFPRALAPFRGVCSG